MTSPGCYSHRNASGCSILQTQPISNSTFHHHTHTSVPLCRRDLAQCTHGGFSAGDLDSGGPIGGAPTGSSPGHCALRARSAQTITPRCKTRREGTCCTTPSRRPTPTTASGWLPALRTDGSSIGTPRPAQAERGRAIRIRCVKILIWFSLKRNPSPHRPQRGVRSGRLSQPCTADPPS